MSESSLSVSYDDLMSDVGHFVGYGANVDEFSLAELEEVDRYVQSGIRQFYFPPAMPGVEVGCDWSFMRPTGTITTVIGESVIDLPDDFGRILGKFHHDRSVYSPAISIIPESRLLSLQSAHVEPSIPRAACIRNKTIVAGFGQRFEVVLWPVPTAVFTLTYRYEAYSGKLSCGMYPLGGMRYSELVTESCLAVAERRANDEKGIHWDQFVQLMAAGVAMDRKQGASSYGQMSGCEESQQVRLRSGEVTYKGNTW